MAKSSKEKVTINTQVRSIKCQHCNSSLQSHKRYCDVCHEDCGCPNVRTANKNEEQEGMIKRLNEVQTIVKAAGCERNWNDFGRNVLNSKVVICKSFGFVYNLIERGLLIVSYYKEVESKMRNPEDNEYDGMRSSVDETLFPYYKDEIIFGALTLNDIGVNSFGACSIILKEKMINKRTSLFEMNSLHFFKINRLVAGQSIMPGYRSSWNNREKLAMTKLRTKISSSTDESLHPQILLDQEGSSDKNADYIEAHIYGEIHLVAIYQYPLGQKLKHSIYYLIWNVFIF